VSTSNFFTGNPDLVEVFDKVIPWDRVVAAVEGPGADVAGTVSTWREVLDLAGRYIATEIAPMIAKPFSPAELSKRVRELLDGDG